MTNYVSSGTLNSTNSLSATDLQHERVRHVAYVIHLLLSIQYRARSNSVDATKFQKAETLCTVCDVKERRFFLCELVLNNPK